MDIRLTVTRLPKIREDAFGFTAGEMRSIGEAGLPHARLDLGLNRFDAPMDPLSEGYKRRKQRRGRRPIRDIFLSGATRQAIAVEAEENHAAVAVQTGNGRVWRRAYFNQLSAQWFGLSPTDADRVDDALVDLHEKHVARAFV